MKARPSKLDPFAERLTEMLLAGKSLAEAQEQLRQDGCSVSLGRLSRWWADHQATLAEEQMLRDIATGAAQCQAVSAAFERHPAPELSMIIAQHRVLAMQFATRAHVDGSMIEMSERATKMALEFAKLEEKRAERELAETKYRDEVRERKRMLQAEVDKAKTSGGITPETLTRIENELKLL